MFTVNRVFPGVAHITDAMGVSMTLIGGEEEALLFDAGYGTEDTGITTISWGRDGLRAARSAGRIWRNTACARAPRSAKP